MNNDETKSCADHPVRGEVETRSFIDAAMTPNGELWRRWFERVGKAATVHVVNATADLVIGERDLRGTWRPIKTAPKDNSWILGLMPNGRTQAVVRWGGGTWEDDSRLCRDPVQWQPLPAAPPLALAERAGEQE